MSVYIKGFLRKSAFKLILTIMMWIPAFYIYKGIKEATFVCVFAFIANVFFDSLMLIDDLLQYKKI